MIIIDSREASKYQKITELLSDKVEIKIENLEVGDYRVLGPEKGYIVERKTFIDLANSIKSGRLIEQLRRLKAVESDEPLMLLEGTMHKLKVFSQMPEQSVIGMLTSIVIDWKIPIVWTQNVNQTVIMLTTLYKRLNPSKKPEYYPLRAKEIFESINDQIRYVVEGLAGVGPHKAINLLRHFKTIKNIVNASEEELSKIEGIGKITARKIYEILNAPFREDEQCR